jgi:N-methylhydantoinase A
MPKFPKTLSMSSTRRARKGESGSCARHPPLRVAADIGGTFTDLAVIGADGLVLSRKVPSTPPDFAAAVVAGISDILGATAADFGSLSEVRHASTVATNTILEYKGARTALVTTAGFRDVLEMRRIRIPVLYDPHYIKPPPLVARRLRFEVQERVGPRGEVIEPLDEAQVQLLAARLKALSIEAVAVCFLHSYANGAHERRVGELLREALPDTFITLSVDILPEIREYERTSTTVINAYVGPIVGSYISSLVQRLEDGGFGGRTLIMQSNGGMLAARAVADKPAQIVECGPAGGVIGAAFVCRHAGYRNVITLDIGGTTAKTCLIEDGRYTKTGDYEVAGGMSATSPMFKGKGYALKFPVIDLAEVGAGGGSVARIDQAGALKVGPESAGAMPGPACYGLGGGAPTVTDANVVLGYLNQQALVGGSTPIDAALSRAVIEQNVAKPLRRPVLQAAYGIHAVANANMTRAIKSVSTYRGRDPRDFVLFAFGGNGGIHAAGLAEGLGMRRIVIPPAAGVFTAVGMLYAEVELELARAFVRALDAGSVGKMTAAFKELEREVVQGLQYPKRQLAFTYSVDVRYRGQAYELTIETDGAGPPARIASGLAERFASEHERTYGYRLPQRTALEIVTLRIRGVAATREPAAIARAAAVEQVRAPAPGESRQVYFGPRYGSGRTMLTTRAALRGKGRSGPLIIDEYDSTVVIPPGWTARLDRIGNIVMDFGDRGA